MKTISKPVINRLPVSELDEFACRQLDRVSSCQLFLALWRVRNVSLMWYLHFPFSSGHMDLDGFEDGVGVGNEFDQPRKMNECLSLWRGPTVRAGYLHRRLQ